MATVLHLDPAIEPAAALRITNRTVLARLNK
jgi:hypothetical protein